MSKSLTKAERLFSFFNISERYKTYNGQIVRISNLYSIKGIEYSFSVKNLPKDQKIGKKNTFEKDIQTIKPRVLRKKKFIYGEKVPISYEMNKNDSVFLSREMYEIAYRNIISGE